MAALALSASPAEAKPVCHNARGAVVKCAHPSAAAGVRSPISQAEMTDWLDRELILLSSNWFSNRYDEHSVFGARIEATKAGGHVYLMKASYKFNGGAVGWIRVLAVGDDIKCVQMWDRDDQRCTINSDVPVPEEEHPRMDCRTLDTLAAQKNCERWGWRL